MAVSILLNKWVHTEFARLPRPNAVQCHPQFRFGLGTDIYITRNFYAALDVSYVLPADDVEKLDFVSIGWGFGYRF
jgi:hypothetical protein